MFVVFTACGTSFLSNERDFNQGIDVPVDYDYDILLYYS